jgi:hypothetical protein
VTQPDNSPTTGLRAGFIQAQKGGAAALGWTVLAAQIYSFVIYFVAGMPFRPWSFVKIGWLFLLSFSRVGLRVTLGGLFGSLLGPTTLAPTGGEIGVTIHVAFLSGTALACWLLFRAGRRAGRLCTLGIVSRALVGACVAIPYATIAFLGSFLAIVRFPGQNVPMISTVHLEALVFPLIMAGASGAMGALLSGSKRGAVVSSAIGGWRALVTALALSLVGLLVLGAIYPGGTSAYVRWLLGHGHLGPLAFAFQMLALPNHSSFMLAPAMGGCDTLAVGTSSLKLMCMNTFAGPHLSDLANVGSPSWVGARTPWAFRLFLLVPLLSTIAGGRWAARDAQGWSAQILTGTGAGLVFAALVLIASWAASVSVGGTIGPITLGPALKTTGALALAWGAVGGAAGGLSANWAQVGGSPVPDPGALVSGAPPLGEGDVGPEDRPDPPSPTSV